MADQIIRPADLPPRASPVQSEIIPVDNGSVVGGATIESIVVSGRPTASQMEAEAGTNAVKAMTPLTTKQSISSEVGVTIASATDGILAQNAVPSGRIIATTSGLTGGGDLSDNRSLSLSPSVISSLALADTAVQPSALGSLAAKSSINNTDWSGTPLSPVNGGMTPGGSLGQVLIKASATNYDASWQTVAAATAVSYAPQVLSSAQKLQARKNTDSASILEALPSLIINGSMGSSQENGNSLGSTSGFHPADQFALYFTASTAAVSIQRVQVRTLANALDQIEFKTTSAKASLGANDFVTITQNIEASRFAASGFGTANAKAHIERFEIRAPAGLYHMRFANSAGNRNCCVPFTIAVGEANIPVVREIIVPPDTTGSWLTGEGQIGLTVELVLAAGSGLTGGSASTWSGPTPFLAASTQFNILSANTNTVRLADVGLKADAEATGVYGPYLVGAVDAVYRPERYVRRDRYGMFVAGAAGITGTIPFSIPMDKPPVLSFTGSTPPLSTNNITNNGFGAFINGPAMDFSYLAIARLTP